MLRNKSADAVVSCICESNKMQDALNDTRKSLKCVKWNEMRNDPKWRAIHTPSHEITLLSLFSHSHLPQASPHATIIIHHIAFPTTRHCYSIFYAQFLQSNLKRSFLHLCIFLPIFFFPFQHFLFLPHPCRLLLSLFFCFLPLFYCIALHRYRKAGEG